MDPSQGDGCCLFQGLLVASLHFSIESRCEQLPCEVGGPPSRLTRDLDRGGSRGGYEEKAQAEIWGNELFFKKKRFCLFIFREGKGGRKRGRETSMRGCFSRTGGGRGQSLMLYTSFFLFLFIYLFLERGEGRERGKQQCVVASHMPPPTRDQDPGMCPDWDSNWRSFGSQACAQSTELHQPGLGNELSMSGWGFPLYPCIPRAQPLSSSNSGLIWRHKLLEHILLVLEE